MERVSPVRKHRRVHAHLTRPCRLVLGHGVTPKGAQDDLLGESLWVMSRASASSTHRLPALATHVVLALGPVQVERLVHVEVWIRDHTRIVLVVDARRVRQQAMRDDDLETAMERSTPRPLLVLLACCRAKSM